MIDVPNGSMAGHRISAFRDAEKKLLSGIFLVDQIWMKLLCLRKCLACHVVRIKDRFDAKMEFSRIGIGENFRPPML